MFLPPKPAERIFQRFICMFDSSGLSRLTAYLIWENRELDRLKFSLIFISYSKI